MNMRIDKSYEDKKNNCKAVIMEEAIALIGGEKIDSRNIINLDGETIGVSLSPNGHAEIRQFYDGTDMLLTYSYKRKCWFLYSREELNIDANPNRITMKGVKAYTAKARFTEKNHL